MTTQVADLLSHFTLDDLRTVQADLLNTQGIFFTLRRCCIIVANGLAAEHRLSLDERVALTRAIFGAAAEGATVKRLTMRNTKDVAFVKCPSDFRSFLRACAFRSGSLRDDVARDLLDDVIAVKYIDAAPPDLEGLVGYCELIDSAEEAAALILEWRRLRRR